MITMIFHGMGGDCGYMKKKTGLGVASNGVKAGSAHGNKVWSRELGERNVKNN